MKYILLFIIISATLVASTPTNLQIISNSIDSIAIKSIPKIYNKKLKVLSKFAPIAEKLESALLREDSTLIITNENNFGTKIVLDSILIEYIESTNERRITLVAHITTLADDNIVEFMIADTNTDTINTDNISRIEDESFPFTNGKLIEESSFWDDVLEPAVFIGAAGIIVYLLFTVRSK